MSGFVHFIVGQLDFLERDHLLAQLFASERGVRMQVESRRTRRIGLAAGLPGALVVRVPVAFVVDRYDVEKHQIPSVRFDAGERHFDGRKHSSAMIVLDDNLWFVRFVCAR